VNCVNPSIKLSFISISIFFNYGFWLFKTAFLFKFGFSLFINGFAFINRFAFGFLLKRLGLSLSSFSKSFSIF